MPTSLQECRTVVLAFAALIGLATGACLYDPDQKCGPAMTFAAAAGACVCDSNAIAVPGGCQACAADEVPVGGMCACAAGETKDASNVCATIAGLGDPCDTGAPCTDPVYSYCGVQGSGTAGSCTKTCASHDDCGAAYTCATWEPEPFCRTFEGVGATCASSSDCTRDAKYCDTYMSHTCVVQGCSLTQNDCPRTTMCCDFSGYGLGTLCVGACQ